MQLAQRTRPFVILSLAGLIAVACAKNREPAERALMEIDNIVKQASADATRYLPDREAIVRAEVAELKASFEQADYSAVLARSPAVLAEVKDLATAVSLKKQEVTSELIREWTTLDASLPPLIGAVRVRIDMLTKSKIPRKGVDLTRAKESIAAGDALWDKAESAFESGQLEDAVALLKDAKPEAEAAAAALQLTTPDSD